MPSTSTLALGLVWCCTSGYVEVLRHWGNGLFCRAAPDVTCGDGDVVVVVVAYLTLEMSPLLQLENSPYESMCAAFAAACYALKQPVVETV